MYVLTFTDTINCSDSDQHVSEDTEIVAVSKSVKKLKKKVSECDDGSSVRWEKLKKGWFSYVYYDGDEDILEEGQYYQITKCEYLK